MVLKNPGVLWCLLPARLGLGIDAPSPRPPSPPPVPAQTQKRSSLTAFFAFSSKRRSVPLHQDDPRSQARARLVNPSSLPSPLRADDDDDYYYAYYPSASTSPVPDPRLNASRYQHPYACATPLHSKPTLPLRHATSQPFRRPVPPPVPPPRDPSSSQPRPLKTSISTPNLASGSRPRSLLKRRPTKERWLSAETWWDALLSPSPRFKIKQAPRPTSRNIDDPRSVPVQHAPHADSGITFPSLPPPRLRAISVNSVSPSFSSTHPVTRSRSVADTPSCRAAFEPALETLVDEPSPTPDQAAGSDTQLPLPVPPLSLEEVIDQGEAFEQQRAQWKKQATRSIGNKHTRSFSRARSKSLGERHARGHHPEGSKSQFNLEFLTARTLLGSQSTMPTVHVTKPSSSSSHSKAYSHSHSQSAYSYTHTSNSHGYSHSHSHSLSNSSKSSRNHPPRGHSRAESWSKSAFLKAGALCGLGQDDAASISADERVPSSSRVDAQGTAQHGDSSKTHSPPCVLSGQVGVAISSSPESCEAISGTQGDHRDRCSSKHTHKSSEYAGPHPSAIDSNLPQLGIASDVSLRHRLPPRPAIHPPITPIAHPYRSASVEPASLNEKPSEAHAAPKVTSSPATTEQGTERASYPHISLSHTDFAQYGVGEALVYAALPWPKKVPEANPAHVEGGSSPTAELTPQEQSLLCDTVVLPREDLDACSTMMSSPPSLTSSTIQMVMSAFDNPDDLDEFQDLFYRPHLHARRDQSQERTLDQVPTDLRSSASNSPLTHLVRKLSEEVHGRRDPLRTPSDSWRPQRRESQDHPSSESGTKSVFSDCPQSSSPPPMDPSSTLCVPIRTGSGSAPQPITVIPEDVHTVSDLESPGPWEDRDNDTFGYPIRHGQFEAATLTSPIQSPLRLSTHLSIQEGQTEDDGAFLSPVTKRFGLSSADVARSSYLTTMSDMSQMSALSDFPLPPTSRPDEHASVLQTYLESTTSSSGSQGYGSSEREGEDEGRFGMTPLDSRDGKVEDEGDENLSDDVEETLRVLRMEPRVTGCDSRRTTFGGSEDMDFITQVHQAQS